MAVEALERETYFDDIIDSFDSLERAKNVKADIDRIIQPGGFKMKKWLTSWEDPLSENKSMLDNPEEDYNGRVLGMQWSPRDDVFKFTVHLNFSRKRRGIHISPNLSTEQLSIETPAALAKQMILLQMNGVYHPMGLIALFTVRAKILLSKLWQVPKQTGWDYPIPTEHKIKWSEFFGEMFQIQELLLQRCLKPTSATGNPSLIVFSDGSNEAFGSCAYIRWELQNRSFCSRLIMSKKLCNTTT